VGARAHEADEVTDAAVEAPSGKGASDENFPVASRLIEARFRPHIMAFYAFVRAADDIADSASLPAGEKLRRLDALEAGLVVGGRLEKPRRLAESLAQTGVTARHVHDMLSAFRQDATKSRYESVEELWDYCERSACPVGRYLVDLHGESATCYPAADALAAGLQVLNHLQDCKLDYHSLDRVYLPLDVLSRCGASVGDLDRKAASPGLRRAIDCLLGECEPRLALARHLPHGLKARRFAAEATVVVRLAGRLAGRLRKKDPLAGRVGLSRIDFLVATVTGLPRILSAGRA